MSSASTRSKLSRATSFFLSALIDLTIITAISASSLPSKTFCIDTRATGSTLITLRWPLARVEVLLISESRLSSWLTSLHRTVREALMLPRPSSFERPNERTMTSVSQWKLFVSASKGISMRSSSFLSILISRSSRTVCTRLKWKTDSMYIFSIFSSSCPRLLKTKIKASRTSWWTDWALGSCSISKKLLSSSFMKIFMSFGSNGDRTNCLR
mmetsp:Transcript_27306/g.48270  ORF Transcript_27306/g.48270 Transcript_27306/m.48270 type:complete len:212 (-) Transcript_27306:1304-1939(-)